jgi:hypothetical protein
MVETLSEVKARVIRQQQERTDERIRELRRERRENIIRESVSEVRVRAREEQRLRTEARVKHWEKVENWVERDSRRIWVVRLSCHLVWFISCGAVGVERAQRYSFLLSPSHPNLNPYSVLGAQDRSAMGRPKGAKNKPKVQPYPHPNPNHNPKGSWTQACQGTTFNLTLILTLTLTSLILKPLLPENDRGQAKIVSSQMVPKLQPSVQRYVP